MKRRLAISIAIFAVGLCGFVAYMMLTRSEPSPPTLTVAKSNDFSLPLHTQLSPTEKQRVLEAPFVVVTSIEAMPPNVRRAFAIITGEREFALANPGEKYQVTDVIVEPGLPFRRLVFAGTSADFWFIYYERGGRSHSYSVVVFRSNAENPMRFLWGGAGFDRARDVQDLRQLVAAGRFRDDEPYYW